MMRAAAFACFALAACAASAHAARPTVVVHGRWHVVVRTRSGRVVENRRFENSLNAGGGNALAELATGNASIVGWSVIGLDLVHPQIEWSLLDPAQAAYESANGIGLPPNGTLTVTRAAGGFVLSGAAAPPAVTWPTGGGAVAITTVRTFLRYRCAAADDLACQNAGQVVGTTFTSTAPNPQIPVQKGEVVAFTVTISFSSV